MLSGYIQDQIWLKESCIPKSPPQHRGQFLSPEPNILHHLQVSQQVVDYLSRKIIHLVWTSRQYDWALSLPGSLAGSSFRKLDRFLSLLGSVTGLSLPGGWQVQSLHTSVSLLSLLLMWAWREGPSAFYQFKELQVTFELFNSWNFHLCLEHPDS